MRFSTVIPIAALLTACSWAQTPAPPVGASQTVSIAPSGTDIRDVLRSLAKQTGARILIGTEVTGKVTANLTDATLEQALTVVTKTTGTRWSRIVVAADKADGLTADQASALVSAAELLSSGALMVQPFGAPAVSVASSARPPQGAATVYLVQTKADPAAIKAAREEARKRTADKSETELEKAIAARMSPQAAKDPGLVKAYAAVQSLQPDQIATLMREFTTHATPEQLGQIGDAIRRDAEQNGPPR